MKKHILAVPKGRILEELTPLLKKIDITPEDSFFDKDSRALHFATNHDNIDIIRVRAFDVATIVAHGGADMGVAGSDVLEEFNYSGLYAPVDLKIGQCRLCVAVPKNEKTKPPSGHIRIATKYPNITTRHFEKQGIQTDCIKLNGAMEIAPALGLCNYIVDLVSTGSTLKANNLIEKETILNISSKLIVKRTSMKMHPDFFKHWIQQFQSCQT